MEASNNSPAQVPEKKKGGFLKTAILGIVAIVIILFVIAVGASCCAVFTLGTMDSSQSGNDNSGSPAASHPTTAPTMKPTETPKPTATPKPLSGYALYRTWDNEQIKANAQKVDWQDFMRNTDTYNGKLIMIHGDIVTSTSISGGYSYTVNINPNLMPGEIGKHGDNYNPQFIEFDYGAKLIDGDVIDLYGVYEGKDSWLGDYPIIKGVYVIYYE